MTKILRKRTVYKGKVVNLEEQDLDFENGKESIYEIISFNVSTGVSALPIDKGDVILISHYQAGIEAEGYSLPTGGLNFGEDPFERMNQELREEIGMRANKLTIMGRFNLLPSYIGSEASYLFLAQDLTPDPKEGDEHYTIKIERFPLNRAIAMVKDQTIKDMRTVAALLWYEKFVR